MTTIVIDLQPYEGWLIVGAFVLGSILTLLIAWPILAMIYQDRGYDKRSREKAETHFNMEALRRNAEALRRAAP